MEEVLLLKCGELVLKGLNRGKFEERLLKIIRNRLRPVGEYNVHSSQSTIYVEPQNGASVDEALEVCKKIFGIVAIARAVVCEKDIEDIVAKGIPYLKPALDNVRTFKVETRRADKRFALTSPQISQRLGGDLHDAYPHLKAQMDDPQITVKVEVRERNAFVSAGVIPCAGGLPTGINGRGMLLLSGGIDSPVAGWMMAKRGLELGAVHFFSYPYTSEEAKQKVLDLAEIVARWSGKLTVSVVPFTKIQTEIRDKCPEDYFTIIAFPSVWPSVRTARASSPVRVWVRWPARPFRPSPSPTPCVKCPCCAPSSVWIRKRSSPFPVTSVPLRLPSCLTRTAAPSLPPSTPRPSPAVKR